MSDETLPGGDTVASPNELPAMLIKEEVVNGKLPLTPQDDLAPPAGGKPGHNPTIGYGFNLRDQTTLIAVLSQIQVNGVSVFDQATNDGKSAASVLAQFESIIAGYTGTPKGQYPTSADLNTALDDAVGALFDENSANSKNLFSLTDTASSAVLNDLVQGYTIAGYTAAAVYSRMTTYLEAKGVTNIPADNTAEALALTSMFYNSPDLLGPELRAALQAGDNAEVWYQIRYQSDDEQAGGIQKRRYYESQVFGLTQSTDTLAQAFQNYEVLAGNATEISTVENKFGSGQTPKTNEIYAANADYKLTSGSSAPVSEAVQTLVQIFNDDAEVIAGSLNSDYAYVVPVVNISTIDGPIDGDFDVGSTDIFVAPTVLAGTQNNVNAATLDPNASDHIVIGTADGDTLTGSAGADILIAGAGSETLNAGAGLETLIAGQGNAVLNGKLGSDAFDVEFGQNSDPTTATETVVSPSVDDSLYVNGVKLGSAPISPTVADTWQDGTYKYQFISAADIPAGDLLGTGFNNSVCWGPGVGELKITPLVSGVAGTVNVLGFNLSEAETGDGFLGLVLPPTLTLAAVGESSTYGSGSLQLYSLTLDAPAASSQMLVVTLANAPAGTFKAVVGDSLESLSANGVFDVPLAAGEQSVQFGLWNTSPVGYNSTYTLSASDPDPAESNSLTIDYESSPADTSFTPNPSDTIPGDYNSIAGVTFYSGDGGSDYMAASSDDDYFAASNSYDDIIIGGSGSNTIQSGGGNTIVDLNGAHDVVTLGGGYNTVNGGSGQDTIYAASAVPFNDYTAGEDAPGDNVIAGNGGTDIILAGHGSNQVYADSQTSVLDAISSFGSPSNQQGDLLSVGDGNNTIVGGNGNDLVMAGSGEDVVVLGPGSDTFIGGEIALPPVTSWSVTSTVSGGQQTISLNGIPATVDPYSNPYSEPYNGSWDAHLNLPNAAANDTVYGGNGDDLYLLGNGDNYVETGNGNDSVALGMGDNTVIAGSGNDSIAFGGGSSYIYGGSGADTLAGGDGNNTILGGSGNSTIYAALGPNLEPYFQGANNSVDYVNGGTGNDVIYGSDGQDTLVGGSGNTTIFGQAGQDSIVGGSGNDLLIGGSGSETIEAGGSGIDTLTSDGSASTTSYLYGGTGSDDIFSGHGTNYDFAGDGGTALAPTEVVASSEDASAATTIYGGLGVDVLQGGIGSAVIYAGDGGTSDAPTSILADSGPTTAYGGLGTDIIAGGTGTDVLYAGDGGIPEAPTSVIAGSGAATLYGGAGAALLQDTVAGGDLIESENGNDTLIGIGVDTLVAGSGDDVLQSAAGSVSVQVNEGFANDSLASSGGTYSLSFASSMLSTDFTVTPVVDTYGGLDLVFSGDGGDVTAYGALAGALSTVSFSDTGALTVGQVIESLAGGDQTLSGNDSVSVSVGNGEVDTLGNYDTISAWGSGDTVNGGQYSGIYSFGDESSLTGGAYFGSIVASGANDTVNAVHANVTVSGANVTASGTDDTLTALGSGDTLAGQGFSTTFVVSDTTDVVSEPYVDANDSLVSSVSYTLPANVDVLTLAGTANISGTGNADNDSLQAGAGDDTLVSGAGVDTLIGGTGNDTFVINNAADVVTNTSPDDVYAIQSSVSYSAPSNVDAITLVGTGNITATANSGNDTLTGQGSGNESLIGGAGNDLFVIDDSHVVLGTVGSGDTVESYYNYSLPSGVSMLVVSGTGGVAGTANSGNDTLQSIATGIVTLIGGAGSDVFVVNNTGDTIQDTSTTTSNAVQSSVTYTLPVNVDVLVLTGTGAISGTGNAASDTLSAGAGLDTLVAGSGPTTLIGGPGNDTFVVNNAADIIQDTASTSTNVVQSSASFTAPTNVNTLILTGTAAVVGTANSGNDTLVAGVGADTLEGGSGADTFVVSSANDVVQETQAGTGGVIEATVTYTLPTNINSLLLLGTSNISGTANGAADSIVGNSGNDSLIAGSGADTLVAGTGVDTFVGGNGPDTFVVNNTADVVQNAVPSSQSSIVSSVAYTLPANVDILQLSGTAALTGTANNDAADTLIAGEGADTLIGGTGSEVFVVNSAEDVVSASGGAASNIVEASFNSTAPSNVTALILTAPDVVGTGNGLNDYLTAAADDTLIAGSGTDTFYANGSDVLVINNAGDVVNEQAGAFENDTLESSVSETAPANFNILELTGTANLTATANSGDDTLSSNSGIDTLIGGAGNDTFVVTDVGDIVQDSSGTASNTIEAAVSYSAPANISTVILTGTSNLTATAGSGADTLVSNTGVDTLVGGSGSDTFIVNSSADVVSVGSGSSVVESAVSYSLPTGVNTLTLTGFENISGTANGAGDLIQANAGYDTLTAGSGIDTLVGGGGNDTFIVNGTGDVVEDTDTGANNTLESSVSVTAPTNVNTVMLTGSSNLVATANAGVDTLMAVGTGSDTLVGGSGDDTFVIDSASDVITDSAPAAVNVLESDVSYTAPSNVNTLILTGSANLTAVGNSAADTLVAGAGADTLVGVSGNDTFLVNSVDDVVVDSSSSGSNVLQASVNYSLPTNVNTLILEGTANIAGIANAANDVLQAGSGDDTLISGSGIDTLIAGPGNDTFVLNNASDVVETAAGGIVTLESAVTYSAPSNVNVLTLTGTGNIRATANNANDTLIAAGSGVDTLVGGAGNEVFGINSASDVVQDSSGTANNVLETSASYTAPHDVNTLELTGSSNISGTANSAADSLVGGAGSDTLVAVGSPDTLVAGSGNTTFVVNSTSDIVQNPYAGASDTLESYVSFTLPVNVDTLSVIGGSAVTEYGNGDESNVIDANSGQDLIYGEAASNTIYGGAGSDTIYAGPYNNIVYSGNGGSSTYPSVVYGDATVASTLTENTIYGGTGYNLLYGGPGTDVIYAGTGTRQVVGGSGYETLYGASGVWLDDSVGGYDLLAAGSGSETLEGTGTDTLIAGSGTDKFEYASATAMTLDFNSGFGTAVVADPGAGHYDLQFDSSFTPGAMSVTAAWDSGSNDYALVLSEGTSTASIDGGLNPGAIDSIDFDGSDPISLGTLLADATTTGITVTSGTKHLIFSVVNSASISGSSTGSDTISAWGSQDTITAGAATEYIYAEGTDALMYAGSGADTLEALGDGDTLYGASSATTTTFVITDSSDDVVQTSSNGGVDVVDSPVSYSLPTNITKLALTGSDDLVGTGNAANDIITGNAGNDTLNAGSGSTTLVAGSGAQLLLGGAGSDSLVAGSGSDTLDSGSGVTTMVGGTGTAIFIVNNGSDTLRGTFAAGDVVETSVSYTLPTGLNTLSLIGSADLNVAGLSNEDYISANSGNDTITELYASGTIIGGSGNDLFKVYDPNAVIQAGDTHGNDTLQADYIYAGDNNYTVPGSVDTFINTGGELFSETANSDGDLLIDEAGYNTLVGGAGSDTLEAGIYDTLVGGAGNDLFIVSDATEVVENASVISMDTIQSSVSYTAPTNVNALTLTGTANLVATGNAGSDVLTANSGNDTLVSGTGVDTLIGGTGNDTFIVNNAADVVENLSAGSNVIESSVSITLPTNANTLILTGTADIAATSNSANDSITGNSGNDTLTATTGNDTLVSGSGVDSLIGGTGTDVFVINNAADTVQVSSSGADSIRASVNATLPTNVNVLILTGTTALSGTANSANDTLTANSGADTLVSGSGTDSLVGGTGNDLFVVNNSADVVTVGATHGNDTIQASVSYTASSNVANLVLLGTSDLAGTGNSLANIVTANSGNDTLTAGSGVATLVGGSGNDTFVVDNAGDVVQDSSAAATNVLRSSVSYTLPTNVNTLLFTGASALSGTGNAVADVMTANSGADTLTAGSGVATLIGGTGNDTFVINNTSDVVQDTSGTASNKLQSSVSYTLPTDVNTLLLTGSGNLTGAGNSANDSLVGNAGADSLIAGSGTDTLAAGTGADTLIGGSGNDTFVVNASADVVLDTSGTATNTIDTSVSYTLPTDVNALTLTGTAALLGTANNATDTLTSNTGADTLVGGSGNDTFVINNAADIVQDTSATATNTAKSAVSYTLPTNVNTLLLTGTAALQGTANSGNDSITGNSGSDTLIAGSGVDTLVAGTGVDTLEGGSSNDTFVVDNASDVVQDTSATTSNTIRSSVTYVLPTNVNALVLTGTAALKGTANSGADTLTSNTGLDTLVGGSGNDTFIVSNASDVIQDTSAASNNVIQATVSFTLPTDVNSLVFTGSTALHGTGNSGDDSMTANTGADTLSAGNGTDTLVSGTGVDSLVGGTGTDLFFVNNASDVVTVGSSHGTDSIEASVSYSLPANVADLILTGTGALKATGNSIINVLTANSGADTLTAGSAATTLIGGTGNDTFVVDSSSDVVQDTSSTATNIIDSSVSYTLPTDVNRLILTGTAALEGTANSGNDTLTANTGADTLVSGTGVDSLVAGTGADLFLVNNASDVVTVGGTHGVDTISSSVSYTASANVADLTLTGTAALSGTGNSVAGVIRANSGNDTLTAGSAVDTLIGGTGNDTFVINNTGDVIQDTSSGSSNVLMSSVSYTLPTDVTSLTLTGTAALSGTGNAQTDLIVANSGADTLTGGTGIAVLEGGRTAGHDLIRASSNQAALVAGAGSSTLTGGAYKDFYAAGDVSDSITTGATANVVSVNEGDGATTLQPTSGASNVLSLGAGIDTEQLYFSKSGNNLVLTDGVAGDSITFTNWYTATTDQNYTTLQVVEIASSSYNSGGGDALRNEALEEFNFSSLVSQFNTAGSPSNWALSNGMPSAQLAGSSTVAYGGDLAYYFGLNGNLTGMDLSAAQSTLTNASYATGTQTIDSWGSISGSGGGAQLLLARPVATVGSAADSASDAEQVSTATTGTWTAKATPLPVPMPATDASSQSAATVEAQQLGPTLAAREMPAVAPASATPTATDYQPSIGPEIRPAPTWTLSAIEPVAITPTVTPSAVDSALAASGAVEGPEIRMNPAGWSATARATVPEAAALAGSAASGISYVAPINMAWAQLDASSSAASLSGSEADLAHEDSALSVPALLSGAADLTARRGIGTALPRHVS